MEISQQVRGQAFRDGILMSGYVLCKSDFVHGY